MKPLGSPSREIVFRVRVVRDVRAKLCACLLVAGACGGPVSSSSCSSSAVLSRVVPPGCPAWLSRGQSVFIQYQNGSVGCPVGCPVVVPPGCPVVVPWLSRGCPGVKVYCF